MVYAGICVDMQPSSLYTYTGTCGKCGRHGRSISIETALVDVRRQTLRTCLSFLSANPTSNGQRSPYYTRHTGKSSTFR